jgi:hypothetical protein
MTATNIIPLIEDEDGDLAEAERVGARAAARGLQLSVDWLYRYSLSLQQDEIDRRNQAESEATGRRCVNPYLILYRVPLDVARSYVDHHTGDHRFLSPGEVLPEMMASS